ncbi:hypothetical protein BDF20DRAFT_822870, partial [Mycotypha africana]|uniref:uncharacterized protein n=1 Tax=Mycotypha africana TaxID=64632 RepID=UPI00230066C2
SVRSDGFIVDFIFSRRRKDDVVIDGHDLKLEDFTYEEIETTYRPSFINSGRRDVCTAACGLDVEEHQIRKCSNKYVQPITWSTCFLIEQSKYNEDLKKGSLKKKKTKETTTQKRRKNWKQKPFEVGDKNKVSLAVFGDGMFGKNNVKLKGLRCGVVSVLFRALKRREAAGDLLVLTIDEFKTSIIWCGYHSEELHGLDDVPGHNILACKSCGILWNRGINACKNMMSIGTTIWNGNGRPKVFSRKKAATPTTSSTTNT